MTNTAPFLVDLIIDQGSVFTKGLRYKNSDGNLVDLSGYTAAMYIKEDYDDSSALIELTTTNGRITLGGAAGTVDLFINATDTAALDFERGVYDLELTPPAGNTRNFKLMLGKITLRKEVTK